MKWRYAAVRLRLVVKNTERSAKNAAIITSESEHNRSTSDNHLSKIEIKQMTIN